MEQLVLINSIELNQQNSLSSELGTYYTRQMIFKAENAVQVVLTHFCDSDAK